MRHRARRTEGLDDSITPNTLFDAARGVGKDPTLSGPREEESDGAPLGDDPSNVREGAPHDGAEPRSATRPWAKHRGDRPPRPEGESADENTEPTGREPRSSDDTRRAQGDDVASGGS